MEETTSKKKKMNKSIKKGKKMKNKIWTKMKKKMFQVKRQAVKHQHQPQLTLLKMILMVKVH